MNKPKKTRSRAALAKLLEDRRSSFPARVEGHARNVFLQQEIRQKMKQHLREAEQHHIGQNISPMGVHDKFLTRARRSVLIASHAAPVRAKEHIKIK